MMLRNAFRLLVTNFSLVWKNLIWIIISLILGVGLGYLVCSPVFDALKEAKVFADFNEFITNTTTISIQGTFVYLVDGVVLAVNVIFANFSRLVLPIILGTLLLIIILGITNAIRNVATTEVLRGHMTSLTKFGFIGAVIRKMGVGALQGLLKFFLYLPFVAIYCCIAYVGYILIGMGGFAYQMAPFVLILLFTLVSALQVTLFSCWAPVIVMHKINAVKSLSKGGKAVSTRFWRTLSNSIVFVLLVIVVNYACAKFSFCVSLIITIPATIVLNSIYQMVIYFGTLGQRYYIDSQMIMTPKKCEMHDKPQKNKYLI